MNEKALAEAVRRELLEFGRRRILIRMLNGTDEFLAALRALLSDTRIIAVDCTDNQALRLSLFVYFIGDGLPDVETAFEAGWRSHATEISLCSGGHGLETAAGLNTIKSTVKKFLLDENTVDGLSEPVLAKILLSFAWTLPTLICFINHTGREGSPAAVLHGDLHTSIPPVLVCRNDSGEFYGADSVLESAVMSREAITQFLVSENSSAAMARLIGATGGEVGLVHLYTGLQKLTGEEHDDVFSALDAVLSNNLEFGQFAAAAAVFGMQFLPGEVAALAGTSAGAAFLLGRKINLWRGHLVGSFISDHIRSHLLRKLLPSRKENLLKIASEVVIEFRGENAQSLRTAGDLAARAGMNSCASLYFERSAEMAQGDLHKADLFRRAAALSENSQDRLLFQAALSLYRGEFYPEAVEVLDSIGNPVGDTVTVLKGLCVSGEDESQYGEFVVPAETDVNNVSAQILKSRKLHREGFYHRAERLLLNQCSKDPVASAVCLFEIGRQLYSRGMVEGSMNTMIAVGREAVSLGLPWLERKALFTCLNACNRAGRHKMVESNLSRLIELTLLSGNKRKLVSVYNLYANSQLLRLRYARALSIYSTALCALSEVEEDRGLKSIILNNMGVAQRRLYRTGEAMHTLMRQVRLSVADGDIAKACVSYGNMARFFIDMWKVDSAADCLETMIEFAGIGRIADSAEPICYISSQLAFMKEDYETAFSLINQSVQLSRESVKKRRLSVNLVKKGSMELRLKNYTDAVNTLAEARDVSIAAGSHLNTYVALMKLTAARCFLGEAHPSDLLALEYIGDPEDTHKGEQMYYHWLLTGSRQSLAASAQLLSDGLAHGLYYYSYLYMLQNIAANIPKCLADAIPLLHNYPSCE
jgi:tetratricopeptide (TPR) repeat protein